MEESRVQDKQQRHIVFLGNGGVGKTTLASSLSGREYDLSHTATHGTNKVSFDESNNIVFVDFGGQEIYRDKVSAQLKELTPVAAILAVSPREVDSVSQIQQWDSLLVEVKGNKIPKFLVVTKSDNAIIPHDLPLDERLVKQFGFEGIYQTSAKLGTGIQELRMAILNACKVEDQDDEVYGEVATVVRVMIEALCEIVSRDPNALDAIEWRDLERIVAVALEGVGFSVQLTPSAKDGGKDVVASCIVRNVRKTFYVEIKHWRKGNRPGQRQVSDFVEINAHDNTDGGLFISSSGFTDATYGRLSELLKQRIRLGDKLKIVSLCQHYVRRRDGIWQYSTPLPELLFEDTISCQT